MGITGLLPLLKKATNKCHVRKFSGCTVGIDAYVWLHKGAFGCAEKLGKGEPTTAYVTYCMKYINLLLSHNIKPILVLDGRNLPSKSETEKKRRAKREENRKNAKEFLRKGMKKEAWECFTRCVDVTPAMAREFIKVLRENKIDYIVAPYEADSQLAYLARKNIIDIVITEDSDLVLFECPKIFFKMSITGDGVLFDQSKLHLCKEFKADPFQFDRFRWMCILSGCDYLSSLPGIGLGRAKKLIEGTNSQDVRTILLGVSKILGLDIQVPEKYIQGFLQAENTFLYQLVFDPSTRQLIPLTPYPSNMDPNDLYYAGSYKEKSLALGIALGNVDTHTLKIVDNFEPMHPSSGYNQTSIWSSDFIPQTTQKFLSTQDLKKATVHSSTIGMQTNISLGSIILKKRPLLDVNLEENNSNDEDLLSMYKTEPTPDKDLTPPKVWGERFSKRLKLNDDMVEDKEEPDIKSEIDSISYPSSNSNEDIPSKAKNPFLKFKHCQKSDNSKEVDKVQINESIKKEQKKQNCENKSSRRSLRNSVEIKTNKSTFKFDLNIEKETPVSFSTPMLGSKTRSRSNSPSLPICLVEKNRIYEDKKNIIVKSQYFKDAITGKFTSKDSPANLKNYKDKLGSLTSLSKVTTTPEKNTVSDRPSKNLRRTPERSKRSSHLSIYTPEKNKKTKIPESQELSGDDETSYLSSAEDSGEAEERKTKSNSSSYTEITIKSDDDEDDDTTTKINVGRAKWKVRGYPPFADQKSKSSSQKTSSCRRLGLARGKVDPKQKTIAAMFALKQKARL